MKKMTVVALVLVLCLAALGVGYANWTDEIVIEGTADTGSVDIEVGAFFSGTYVYKNLDTDALVVYGPNPPDPVPANLLYVGSAYAEPGAEDDTIKMTWDNVFPTCFPWKADAQLHYIGTIPGKVTAILVEPETGSEWILPYLEVKMKFMKSPPNNTDVVVGTQLHDCDWVSLVVNVKKDLPQTDEMMNRHAEFTIRIVVEQWAECMTP
jgi:hypothetical protein